MNGWTEEDGRGCREGCGKRMERGAHGLRKQLCSNVPTHSSDPLWIMMAYVQRKQRQLMHTITNII